MKLPKTHELGLDIELNIDIHNKQTSEDILKVMRTCSTAWKRTDRRVFLCSRAYRKRKIQRE